MENNLSNPPSFAEPSRAHFPLPLQLELEAVQRVLASLRVAGALCLDIGFKSADACRRLRTNGGYWTSVAVDRKGSACLAAGLVEEVAQLGPQATLPFEDKQFDVVVLALGSLSGNRDTDAALIRECHRVLKVSGCLILTVEYFRPFGLVNLVCRHQVAGAGGQYSEAALFDLLKTGFDWLGLRSYCRFCVQMVRQWVDRQPRESGHAPWLAALFWVARVGDFLTFFSRGYMVTAYGRRKGWRARQTPKLADGRSISETVLLK